MIKLMVNCYGEMFAALYSWENVSKASSCQNALRFIPIVNLVTAIASVYAMFPSPMAFLLVSLWKKGGGEEGLRAHCAISFVIIDVVFMVLGLNILLLLITNLIIGCRRLCERFC